MTFENPTHNSLLKEIRQADMVMTVLNGKGRIIKNRYGPIRHTTIDETIHTITKTLQLDIGIDFFNDAFRHELTTKILEVVKRHFPGGDHEYAEHFEAGELRDSDWSGDERCFSPIWKYDEEETRPVV